MKTGTLPSISNAETWMDIIKLFDDGDGVAWDVSDIAEVTIKLRDPVSGSTVLEGSLTGGEIVQIGAASEGVFQFEFSADTMGGINPKTYEVGVLATDDDDRTAQLILGFLPVLNGL